MLDNPTPLGPNSGIAKALGREIIPPPENGLIVVSRNLSAYEYITFDSTQKIKVSDYSESSINSAIKEINNLNEPPIKWIFICLGLLHSDSFKPGTTDTELSKPFPNNVPNKRLFTSEFVAKQLLSIVEDISVDGKLSYIDWQGKTID